jgi:hypothetical protein
VDQWFPNSGRRNRREKVSGFPSPRSSRVFLSFVFQELGSLTCSDSELIPKHRVLNILTGFFGIKIGKSVRSVKGIRTHGTNVERSKSAVPPNQHNEDYSSRNSPSSSTEVKNKWRYTSNSPCTLSWRGQGPLYILRVLIKLKVKFTLQQAMKAQRGSRGIDQLFL